MNARAYGGFLLVGSLISACSLLGLGEHELRACDVAGEPSPCEALNAALPEGQCERYACAATGFGCELRPRDDDGDGYANAVCAGQVEPDALDCDDTSSDAALRHPGRAESCDGIDNDCDGYIDEGEFPDALGPDLAIGRGALSLAYTSLGDGPLLLLTERGAQTGSHEITRALLGDRERPRVLTVAGPDAICDRRDLPDVRCNFAELALASAGDALFAAAVNRAGCAVGQLRFTLTRGSELALDLGAASPASNLGYGVELEPERECTQTGACPGARAPALAALASAGAGRAAQALAVWLAPTDASTCDRARFSRVMGLGLFVRGAASAPYVTGSGDGRAEPLGQAPASGAPAVVAYAGAQHAGAREPSSGYFVAYPSDEGIELQHVPQLSAGQALPSDVLHATLAARGASHVALSAPSAPGGALSGLALAFRASGERGAEIHFTPLIFDPGDAPHIYAAHPPHIFAIDGEVLAGPSLAYEGRGFAVEDAADASGSAGGFLLVWVEGSQTAGRLMGVRIAERELRALGPPMELDAAMALTPAIYRKQTARVEAALHIAYGSQDTLRERRLSCQRDD